MILRASFWRILLLVILIIPIVFVLGAVEGYMSGNDPLGNMAKHWSRTETIVALAVVPVLVALSAVLYYVARLHTVTISGELVAGREGFGDEIWFDTSAISSVELKKAFYGASAIHIHSELTGNKIILPLIGLDCPRLQKEVALLLGENHPLVERLGEC